MTRRMSCVLVLPADHVFRRDAEPLTEDEVDLLRLTDPGVVRWRATVVAAWRAAARETVRGVL